ncbi:unnamed protein product [Prunus armeniaca]|uniref:Reverse transcriptase domain-containing protein n=1 Tax=Prunus armeniaca TaxID=36596 RepID=A0A6J5XZ43_PRUAR|nr:unnamed protein product [Prunus armeniaca]
MFWKQRSRISWLKEGDANTRLFHLTTIQRRQQNRVLKWKNERGNWIAREKNIGKEFHNFFSNLLRTAGPRDWDEIIGNIPSIVTEEMNSDLLAPITEEEVKVAAVQLGAWKARGPDGFQIYLYQKYWKIMSNIVSSAAIDFRNGSCSLEEINKTFIALIPKVQTPENTVSFSIILNGKPVDFLPIEVQTGRPTFYVPFLAGQ